MNPGGSCLGRLERGVQPGEDLCSTPQDPHTLALRPKVGWAVREAEKLDVLLARLTAEHTTLPGPRSERTTHLPPDLARFYHQTDGAELSGRDGAPACRIVSAGDMEPLDWGEIPEQYASSRGPGGRIWHRLARLADGGWLAINLDPNRRDPRPKDDNKQSYDPGFRAICRGTIDSQGRPGQNPVVALSFTELLERLLGQGRTPFWLDPQFPDYGDAEQYTRRD